MINQTGHMPALMEVWEAFKAERSISVCKTSMGTDYRQVTNWLQRSPIQDLDQARQICIWMLQQEPAPSARKVVMYIRGMCKWAAAEDVGLLEKNPVQNFRMPKASQHKAEITVIPREQVPLIMTALSHKVHHKARDWSLYAEFMLQTAMRTGEVRALKWEDIKDERILVHANYTLTHGYKSTTKTNKPRWVPLNQRVQEILTELPRSSEYLFPWNRHAFQSFFHHRMVDLYVASLIDHIYRPYDLRHVAISRWIEAGIPVMQAAKWAGNTSEVIWKHYANATTTYDMPVL
jgi:integrase